ncbi:MAG: LptF/LptG family permease [Candidatus Cloacimonetes bacterium]|nr:LptF/LptG family permease [Candidatus Cloacimonadota bacterium]
MKILERYILRENMKPFLVSLVTITFILLLDHLLDLLNLIIDKRLGFVMIVSIFSLSLPFIMALSIPMSVLTAAIMSFGRLSTDNELIAFKSCGINVFRLLKPTVLAAIFLALFMMFFNNSILPDANHKLKNLMFKANSRRPISVLKPGVFTQIPHKRYTIYVREHDGNQMRGIVIYDRENSQSPQMISAERGYINLANGGNALYADLYDGQMHVRDSKDSKKYQVRQFKKFTLNLPDLGIIKQETGTDYRGDRELSTSDMMGRIDSKELELTRLQVELIELRQSISEMKKDSTASVIRQKKKFQNLIRMKEGKISDNVRGIRMYQVEIHKKYAIAVACIIFVLIGAPVGMMTKTSGVGMAFSVSSIVFLIYYMMLLGGEELADRGFIAPAFSMWIANLILGIIGIILIILAVKESKAIDLQDMMRKGARKIFPAKPLYKSKK